LNIVLTQNFLHVKSHGSLKTSTCWYVWP